MGNKINYEAFAAMSEAEKEEFKEKNFMAYIEFTRRKTAYDGADGRKIAAKIVADFEEQGISIKAAKNILDLVLIMIESSKVSPR